MRASGFTRLLSPTALAAISGLCWGLALPDVLGGALVLLGAAAAGRALTGEPLRDAARGVLAGLWWFSIALAWVPDVMDVRDDPPVYAVALVLAEALPMALPWALASLAVRRGVDPAWAWTLAWLVAVEPLGWVMPVPFTPAHVAVGTAGFVWPAAVGGVPLFSAVLAGVGAGLPRPGAGLVLGLWALVGAVWIDQPDHGAPLRVGVLQPGGDVDTIERSDLQEERATTLLQLAMEAGDAGAQLVVAPEGAWPWPQEHPDTTVAWGGLPPAVVGGGRARLPRVNRLIAFDDAAVVDTFDKRLLVPAMERRFLGLGADVWAPGTGPRRIDLAGQVLGPLVCYEVVHPSALREALAEQARVLVVPSNDADLVGGHGATWSLAMARMAAITTRLPLVRSTTNGRSAVLAPSGRSLVELAHDTAPHQAVVDIVVPAPRWSGVGLAPAWTLLGALAWLAALLSPRARRWCSRRG